jgi:hypothetical protein
MSPSAPPWRSPATRFLTYGGVWYAHTVGAPLTQRLVYDARNELVESDYARESTLLQACHQLDKTLLEARIGIQCATDGVHHR